MRWLVVLLLGLEAVFGLMDLQRTRGEQKPRDVKVEDYSPDPSRSREFVAVEGTADFQHAVNYRVTHTRQKDGKDVEELRFYLLLPVLPKGQTLESARRVVLIRTIDPGRTATDSSTKRTVSVPPESLSKSLSLAAQQNRFEGRISPLPVRLEPQAARLKLRPDCQVSLFSFGEPPPAIEISWVIFAIPALWVLFFVTIAPLWARFSGEEDPTAPENMDVPEDWTPFHSARNPTFLVLIVLVLGCFIEGVLIYNRLIRDKELGETAPLVMGFALASCGLLGLAATMASACTRLCQPGLCLTGGLTGAISTVHWKEIEWMMYGVVESHGVVVHTIRFGSREGRSLKLRLIGKGGEEVASLCNQVLVPLLLPEQKKRLTAGEEVDFGPLILDRQSIRCRSLMTWKTIELTELASVVAQGNSLSFKLKDAFMASAAVSLNALKNAALLPFLLTQAVRAVNAEASLPWEIAPPSTPLPTEEK